jgi:putative hemolysin
MKPVSVRSIVKHKSPGVYPKIPGFIFRMLERLLHQRELNKGLKLLQDLRGVAFAQGVVEYLGAKVSTFGEENLEGLERPIIAANHPLGGLDGVVLISEVGKIYPNLAVPANDLLMHLEHLRDTLVPVNKIRAGMPNVSQFQRALTSNKTIIQFPAGLCSRKRGGIIRDVRWSRSFVIEGRKAQRPIVPTYISGKNSWFFYTLARVRKLLGLKFNIEMLFLADEMFKQKNKDIVLVFGTPIYPEEYSTGSSKFWSREIQRRVYQLAEQPFHKAATVSVQIKKAQ